MLKAGLIYFMSMWVIFMLCAAMGGWFAGELALPFWASFIIWGGLFWVAGSLVGLGLYLFKYIDYSVYRDEYLIDTDRRELYNHDHKWQMIVRNFLFYVCLSWRGVYSFYFDED